MGKLKKKTTTQEVKQVSFMGTQSQVAELMLRIGILRQHCKKKKKT